MNILTSTLSIPKKKLNKFFQNQHDRSKKLLNNVILSFGVKCGSIIVGFVLVPLTITYISPIEYGVWLIINSVIGWMSFFDIGLGNGLRNRLSSSLAKGEYAEAKKYVSSAYFSVTIIAVALMIMLGIIIPQVDWFKALNLPAGLNLNITSLLMIVSLSFCTQFIFQLINTVLIGSHQTAKASLITFLGQVGVLVITFILTRTVVGSLNNLIWVLTFTPVLVFAIASVYLFSTSLKQISPGFKSVNINFAKKILSIGGYFFVIQIGTIILFQTDNIIVTKLFGPGYVTNFNVAYKLFSSITLVFGIIIAPYWSAFTDAHEINDLAWMKKSISNLRKVFLALSLLAIGVYVAAPLIYRIWIGHAVVIARPLSFAMLLYVVSFMWQTLHVYFLNGIGKIRLQLILVVISALLNIPLAIFLGRRIGLSGVISANTAVFLIMGIIFSIQVQKILKGTATGIWNK